MKIVVHGLTRQAAGRLQAGGSGFQAAASLDTGSPGLVHCLLALSLQEC